jgi:hypothetical protein
MDCLSVFLTVSQFSARSYVSASPKLMSQIARAKFLISLISGEGRSVRKTSGETVDGKMLYRIKHSEIQCETQWGAPFCIPCLSSCLRD